MKTTTLLFCLFILSSLGLFAQTNVTFKLDMTQQTGFTTPEVNGSFNGWCGATCNPMTDANSDGIWEATIALSPGDYEYKFAYDNWVNSGEQLIPGSSCTVTNSGFTNRFLTVGSTAMVLPTVCYGSCSACGVTPPPPTQAQVTFKVDVSQSGLPAGSIPEVNGTFNNWCGSCNAMTDANADGIWETTILLNSGSYEYKFSYSTWTGQETLVPGSSCTITTGANTNRSLTVGSAAMVLPSVCYGSCTACSTGPSLTQMNLPVTFEGTTVDYGVIGFEGAEASTIVTDPTNSSNTVVKVIKSASAQPWAGTTITAAAALGLASPVPFSASNTSMSLKVWSPDAGIQVRLKVENHADPTQSVETEATTTVANGWQTLVFNFNTPTVPPTAAFNPLFMYTKASVFMNFAVAGSSVGEKTYYFDDLMMAGPSLPVPVTFNVDMSLSAMPAGSIPEVNGTFNNWCGNCNAMTDANSDGIWETTISLAAGLYEYKFSYSNWSGEETLISGSSCTITTGTTTNRTLTVGSTAIVLPSVCWNSCLACGVSPTSPLQPAGLVANSPTTSSIFVACGPNQVGGNNILYRLFYSPTASAPMNPQTASEYTFGTTANDGNGVGPFGFNVTGLQAATNYTFWLYQYNTADQLFSTPVSVSETTLGGGTAVPITFTVDMNQSSMPAGSIPEVNGTFNNWCGSCAPMTDSNSDGIWEIIISLAAGSYEYKFSYSNWTGQESLIPGSSCTITTGTNTNRALTVGSAAMVLPTVCYGSCTACSTGPFLTQMNLPVTFEGNTVDYGVIGFEGAEASTIVTDPTNSANTVVKVIKSASAQPWAGTTITAAAALGLASPVPFSTTNTLMSLKVWSPDAGIQVRLKVENHADPTQSVETEATTTVANGWQTLVFNFNTPTVPPTAAFNPLFMYTKASVFMNFAVAGSSVGEKTYYFDDLMMYDPLPIGPTSSILSGSSAICTGDSTNLSVEINGGTSPYTVVITDGTNNYSSSGTSPVLLTVSPTLTTTTYSIVSVSGGGVGTGNTGTATVSVTPNSINSLTISAVDSYTWSNTGQTYDTSGTYTGTTENCVTEQLILTITGAGLEDLSEMGISVQPNPSNGLFSIMNSEQLNLTASITDGSGRAIYSADFTALENIIDISNVARGIYYLKLSSLNYSKVVQIFKN